jgi:hypothetical protein
MNPRGWRSRLGALLEVLGVFVTGTVVARMILRAGQIASGSIRDQPPGATIDYLALASARATTLFVQYGIILGVAFLIGWWHRRRRLSSYGVTAAGFPPRAHFTIALVELTRFRGHLRILRGVHDGKSKEEIHG